MAGTRVIIRPISMQSGRPIVSLIDCNEIQCRPRVGERLTQRNAFLANSLIQFSAWAIAVYTDIDGALIIAFSVKSLNFDIIRETKRFHVLVLIVLSQSYKKHRNAFKSALYKSESHLHLSMLLKPFSRSHSAYERFLKRLWFLFAWNNFRVLRGFPSHQKGASTNYYCCEVC